MSNTDSDRHHYLITGEIVFTPNRESDDVNAIRLNGVLIQDEVFFDVATLGKCQQILQLNFHQRMQDDNINVVDVIIYSLTYLGFMTKDQFHKEPEGTKLQEKKIEAIPKLEDAVAEAITNKGEETDE